MAFRIPIDTVAVVVYVHEVGDAVVCVQIIGIYITVVIEGGQTCLFSPRVDQQTILVWVVFTIGVVRGVVISDGRTETLSGPGGTVGVLVFVDKVGGAIQGVQVVVV